MAARAAAIVLFAVAMAYVESACVLYLRTLYGGIDPAVRGGRAVSPDVPNYLGVELVREAATIVMLAAAGEPAGGRPASRLGYFVVAFGVWDIFYYVWLHVFTGWPADPLDWDVLFLIPLPWWGPVVTPALVAAEMAAAGLLLAWRAEVGAGPRRSPLGLTLLVAGLAVLLVAFMWDALLALWGLRPPAGRRGRRQPTAGALPVGGLRPRRRRRPRRAGPNPGRAVIGGGILCARVTRYAMRRTR